MKKGQVDTHVLVLVTLGLTAFGLVMVYSATSAPAALGGGDPVFYLKREGIYALIGVALLMVGSRADYRALRFLAPVLMLTSLGLCFAVLAIGEQVNGARRWLGVGSLTFQPSELAKLSLAIWAAAYLARRPAPRTLKELARPIGLTTGLFAALILLEPDLGTVIAIGIVLGAILVVSGTPLRVLAAGGSIAFGLAMAAIWFEPYRRARFFSFLDPGHDPQGAGYQTFQGIMGLGSGGFFGVGIGHGVQKVNYLPEAHTDMIFATIGEELGLLGASLVIAAYVAFAYAGLRVALRCKDPFGKRLAAGMTTLVCGQALINLAAVLGLAPLTGITLPFVSYGGSSLIVSLASVGVLLNIAGHGSAARAQVPDRSRGDGRPRAAVARGRGGARGARRQGDLRRVAGSHRGAARS
ncbi:MAG: putative lipid II flippase FtsW [Actinomycetota bacterium]